MSSVLPLMFMALAIQNPEVEISTLQGERFNGELQQLTSSQVTLQTEDETKELSTSNLLEVRFSSPEDSAPNPEKFLHVKLTDGSHLYCSNVETDDREVRLQTPSFGSAKAPLSFLKSIRFGSLDSQIEEDWQELFAHKTNQDLLVIRKKDVLDYLEGVVGTIDEKRVHFLLDGDEIPVNREKVFGILYYKPRESESASSLCRIELPGSQVLQAKSVSWNGAKLQAVLVSGDKIDLSPENLRSLDFSRGKVQYLSQMEPRDVEYTPFFDVTWEYRRDSNLDGGLIQLGGKSYPRGLCIHSRTHLRYRINGDYRRFQAVMGIDDSVAPKGNVEVVISGDGETLLETEILGNHDPRPIDLDVSGVRDLEILVDFGGDLDISDHLDLADAKVTK